jgi:hypothetical protein
MHMHIEALCMNCRARRALMTPMPDIVILSSMCENCGWNDLVGADAGVVCHGCRELWIEDVERERGWPSHRHS